MAAAGVPLLRDSHAPGEQARPARHPLPEFWGRTSSCCREQHCSWKTLLSPHHTALTEHLQVDAQGKRPGRAPGASISWEISFQAEAMLCLN